MKQIVSYFLLWYYHHAMGDEEAARDAANAFLISVDADPDIFEDGLLAGTEDK